jgi:predicted DNA binding CopG/RHH family protein
MGNFTILFPRLNQTNDFEGEDAQHTNMYVSTAESRKNRLDHLKMGNFTILFPRLNQTNDFKGEDAQHTNRYVSTAESRKNRLDHLKMGNSIKFFYC